MCIYVGDLYCFNGNPLEVNRYHVLKNKTDSDNREGFVRKRPALSVATAHICDIHYVLGIRAHLRS